MNAFVETYQAWLMHVCLCGLLVLSVALAVGALWRHCSAELERITAGMRRMPLLVRAGVIVVVGNLIVYGSTKAPSGQASGDGDSSGDDSDAGVMSLAGDDVADLVDTGFTEEDVRRGFVHTGTYTNEAWSFAMPDGAQIVGKWGLRGGSEDIARVSPNLAVSVDGRILAGSRVFAPLHMPMGVVPEANWGLLPQGAETSRVWYGPVGSGAFAVTWENLLANRTTNDLVTVQAEFRRDGGIVYRYGALSDDVATNAVVGCWSDGAGLGIGGLPGMSSVRLHRIEPEDLTVLDRDGDGISTYDEIHVYGTDPDVADTDGDGALDGDEVAAGGNPLVRDATDSEILARLAAQAGDSTFGEEGWVVSGELAASALWCGFAADVAGPDPVQSDSTNEVTVYQRTIAVDPHGGWTSYYLSARPDAAHGWWLEGLRLDWADDAGGSGSVTASPMKDSLRLELSSEATSVTISLVAAGGRVRSAQPMYFLSYTPRFEVAGGQAVGLQDGTVAYVFTNATEAAGALSVNRGGMPCRRRFAGDAELDATCAIPEGVGSWSVFPWARSGTRAAMDWGNRIVVINPHMTFGGSHGYGSPSVFPYDTPWLWENWWKNADGTWRCGCVPEISWGGVTDPWLSSEVIGNDGLTASGVIRYFETIVWSGLARHALYEGAPNPEVLRGCTCSPSCPHCTCKRPDGDSSGSVRFRVSLGEVVPEQVAGFLWFRSEGPIQVSVDSFETTVRQDALVSSSTSGGTVAYTCAGGRSVVIASITNGVSVSVSEPCPGAASPVWEITNPEGCASVVRFVKRIGAVVESDRTHVCMNEDGNWVWTVTDNLEPPVPSAQETRFLVDGTNYVYDASDRLVSMAVVSAEGVTNVIREISYNAEGRVSMIDDGTNGVSTVGYDESGRIVSVTTHEGTVRVLYDADGSPHSLDVSGWNGEDLGSYLQECSMGIMLMSDDPPVEDILPGEAVWYYLRGNGAPRAVSFHQIDTSEVRPSDFKAVRDFMSACPAPGEYEIEGHRAIPAKGDLRFVLGTVTVRISGTITVSEGCRWTFNGDMTCCDDTYDFDSASRDVLSESLTSIGYLVFGPFGTPYTIHIRGTKPITGSGGCGGSN